MELEHQKRELEVDHQRRLAAIKEEAEAELRTQLRRQAAAHSDHLADVLTVQVPPATVFSIVSSQWHRYLNCSLQKKNFRKFDLMLNYFTIKTRTCDSNISAKSKPY